MPRTLPASEAMDPRREPAVRRIAFVVPRYGPEIVGGAETLARGFAERLPRDRFEVEVWTTCAIDHHSWRNELPPGAVEIDGVLVRRFAVAPRNVERFLAVQAHLSAGFPLTVAEELDWLAGSVHSEELYEWIEQHGAEQHALFFLPYLFGTTLVGAHVRPERSVLVPCLHDEPFAYLAVTRHLFASVRGSVFNSAAERDLARHLFGVAADAPVVGMGFDEPASGRDGVAAFRRTHAIEGDYLLYFGRKEEGKNLPLLLDAFRRCPGAGSDLWLVVAGDGRVADAARSPGLVDLPRLDDRDKAVACAGALALCQPSLNESFSIVIMEAWLQETPVLVHADCAVTRSAVEESGGGLTFRDAESFAAALTTLRSSPSEWRSRAVAAKRWVLERHSWPVVVDRFAAALHRLDDPQTGEGPATGLSP